MKTQGLMFTSNSAILELRLAARIGKASKMVWDPAGGLLIEEAFIPR